MSFQKWVSTIIFCTVAILITASALKAQMPPCKECHSKRPGALKMHKKTMGRNCFTCHVRGQKIRQKGGIPEEKHQEFLKQRVKDPVCLECHKKDASKAGSSLNDSVEHPKHKLELAGKVYCPKCGTFGDPKTMTCNDCGGPALDLDKLMRASAMDPDQAYCRQCHPMTGNLLDSHTKKLGKKGFTAKKNCLHCHNGHSDCASCHAGSAFTSVL